MARHKSRYIFGLHDPGGEHIMAEKGKKGWILFVHAIGLDPNNCPGFDYSRWADQGFGIIARLNHGYEPDGTIPHSDKYEIFAQCCANWVRNSRGCHIWIIGNEMNYAVERPGVRYDRSQDPPVLVDPGEVITPAKYARCYRLCREAIHRVPGHEDDEVLIGAVAPWNAQTTYPGNPHGDWVQYFRDILELLGPENCDGITIHTYTHGADPRLVYEPTKLAPPFDKYHFDFLAYRDFMNAIPASMRHLPVYITETDQDVEWKNENTGWVQRAYGEIDWWNRQPGHQQIRALILYRWPKGYDKWGIEGKQGVIEDFKAAMNYDYVWREEVPPMEAYRVEWLKHSTPARMRGDTVVNVRLKIRNAGSNTWKHAGDHPVHLGFHWYKDGRQVLLKPERDFRTPLPADVPPGNEVTLNAKVATPAEAGKLILQWDLVEEGVTWFADRGSKPLTLAVEVEPAPLPDEEYFEVTKHWVRGVFLDFYRRYGLDITGYPISEQFVDPSSGLPTQVFQRIILEEVNGKARLKLAGQYLQEAQEEIARLKARIEELQKQPTGPVLPPSIQDVTETLPRDAARFHRRQRDDIRYLVIHHTAVAPSVGVDRVAQSHKARGWPGTLHHYFIDGEGRVLQTNPLEEIVDDSQEWLRQGVNICFAGNFTREIPSEAQLTSGAQLCAWLLQELNLPPEAIKGAKEFYSTQSPGIQWAEGKKWREMLLQRVREILEAAGPADTAALQAQIAQLQSRLAAARQEVKAVAEERDRFQAQVQRLQQEVDRLKAQPMGDEALQQQIKLLQGQLKKAQERIHELQEELQRPPVGPVVVPQPPIQDIVDELPKHETLKYETRPLSQITHLSIHHSAVAANIDPFRVAAYQIKADPSRNKDPWPGIGYHYYIGPDGTIYQTNRWETLSYHTGGNNSYTLGICFAGSFMDVVPTPKQIESGGKLLAWLMQELNIPIENIWGHKEFPKNRSTSCPGAQWLDGQKWKEMLLAQVRAVQQGLPGPLEKAIRHYMLFWYRSPELWAESDWANAANYIAQFHPVCGFSEEAASHAEYVLIVGGTAGVSWQTEENLRRAGCKVERVAGKDEADTKRLLDELAASGRPFKTFDIAEPWWL